MEPGQIHESIARAGLKTLQSLASKRGVQVNVGDLENPKAKKEREDEIAAIEAGEEVEDNNTLKVTARIIAHIGHRIPGAKRINKRSEGEDKNSGILSDLVSLAGNLYQRNEAAINDAIAEVLSGKGINIPTSSSSSNGSVHVDFGRVRPVTQNNNGGSKDA